MHAHCQTNNIGEETMELSSELIELETEDKAPAGVLDRMSRALARVPAMLARLFAGHVHK